MLVALSADTCEHTLERNHSLVIFVITEQKYLIISRHTKIQFIGNASGFVKKVDATKALKIALPWSSISNQNTTFNLISSST